MAQNFHKVKNQYLTTIIVNIVTLSQGCNIGWYSPALPLLISTQTPLLDGPLNNDEIGWIGSFLALGAIIGTLFFGFLSNFIGYKKSLLLCSIPITVAWIFIIFGTQSWHLLMSRLCSGITGGGAFSCIPQFIAEIASDFIRGRLNSMIQINCYVGVLCGFIGGSYLNYQTNPLVMIVLPLIFLCGFIFIPDSPQYLLKQNRIEEAEKSLRFYRNCPAVKSSSTTIDKENNLEEYEFLQEFEKFQLIAKQNEIGPKLKISDFFNKRSMTAMMISPFLMAVSQFSGSFAISNYAVTIFKETGSTIDPNLSSIVMAVIQVGGTYTASHLMDKIGRKVLLIVSTSGGMLALIITGTYAYLARIGVDVSTFNLLPMCSISFFIFICAIGILPVPYVMISEVLPQKIRRIGATICTCTVFIFQFIMLKIFPILLATLDLYGCMWTFACVSTAGLLFTIFVVKETKGKNLDVLNENENK